jgi:hypothetical protein
MERFGLQNGVPTRLAYLDTAIQVPFMLNVGNAAMILDASRPQSIAISLNSDPQQKSCIAFRD